MLPLGGNPPPVMLAYRNPEHLQVVFRMSFAAATKLKNALLVAGRSRVKAQISCTRLCVNGSKGSERARVSVRKSMKISSKIAFAMILAQMEASPRPSNIARGPLGSPGLAFSPYFNMDSRVSTEHPSHAKGLNRFNLTRAIEIPKRQRRLTESPKASLGSIQSEINPT